MKTLKTKKVNLVICWNGLKNTPPKLFPTIGEMEKTADILELLKNAIPEFVEVLREGEKISEDIQAGKFAGEESLKVRRDFAKKSNALEQKVGNSEIPVEFENETFNTFFQQFERWGKEWFVKLEPYLAFRKEMTATNGQPKGK